MEISNLLKERIEKDAATLPVRFARLLETFSQFAETEGYKILPFRGASPVYFESLDPVMQKRVYEHFMTYVDVCIECVNAKESLNDDRKFLWRMMQKLKVRPSADLFSILEEDNVIEIYDLKDFVQIFRNLRFFARCSFSLDEILCRPFFHLYKRDQEITDSIMSAIQTTLSSPKLETFSFNLPPYILEEIDSPALYKSVVENKYLSPLLNAERIPTTMVSIMVGHSSVSHVRDYESDVETEIPLHV